MAQLKQVHFGTGALGLGYAGWWGEQLGHKLILTSRTSPSSKAKNDLLEKSKSYRVDFFGDVPQLVAFDEFVACDLPASALLAHLCDADTQLVTTCVTKKGLPGIAEVLARAIEARIAASAPPLFILPLENGVSGADVLAEVVPHLQTMPVNAQFNASVVFLSCAVDRICKAPFIDGTEVAVGAEQFHELIIEQPGVHGALLGRLIPASTGLVSYVPDLRPYKARKRWILNGGHLLIALHAHARGEDYLDKYLANHADALPRLKGLLTEIGDIFSALDKNKVFTRQEIQDYCDNVEIRFSKSPDLISRIAHRFSGLAKLEEFMDDYYDKITNQAVEVMETTNRDFHHISYTLALCQMLIKNRAYI